MLIFSGSREFGTSCVQILPPFSAFCQNYYTWYLEDFRTSTTSPLFPIVSLLLFSWYKTYLGGSSQRNFTYQCTDFSYALRDKCKWMTNNNIVGWEVVKWKSVYLKHVLRTRLDDFGQASFPDSDQNYVPNYRAIIHYTTVTQIKRRRTGMGKSQTKLNKTVLVNHIILHPSKNQQIKLIDFCLITFIARELWFSSPHQNCRRPWSSCEQLALASSIKVNLWISVLWRVTDRPLLGCLSNTLSQKSLRKYKTIRSKNQV